MQPKYIFAFACKANVMNWLHSFHWALGTVLAAHDFKCYKEEIAWTHSETQYLVKVAEICFRAKHKFT